MVLSIWDISVAFFHAVMDELVYVHPAGDLVPPGWCWKLRKSKYGTGRASRLWADYVRRALEDDGSEMIAVFSMFFVNHSKRHIVAVWGDDFAFIVASEMLPHLTELLERNFECKLIGNIGPRMTQNVVKQLNRKLAWTEAGFAWHADTKHSRSVIQKHGFEEGKSTSAVSPGSKISGTNVRDSEDDLSVQESKEYASSAGILTGQICSLRWDD